jgi:hypothetical protein
MNLWLNICSCVTGSSKMVAEFVCILRSWYGIGAEKADPTKFEYSINTILYQRGVYPIEDFHA